MKKTTARLVGAGLLGATVLGSVAAGVVAAAPASAATTQTASASQDVTRGFDIVNMTKHTLTLMRVDGPGERDGYAPVGTTIAPGQTYHYEKVYYFAKYKETTLSFQFSEPTLVGGFDATISVDAFGGTKMLTDADALFSVENHGWSGRMVLMEQSFSINNVPAADAQKQADLLNATCVSGLASCAFTPMSKVPGQPQVTLVAGGVNNTATARPESFTTKTTATMSSSVETVGSAKVTIKGIFEAGMTWKYGNVWTDTREVTKTHSYTLSPYTNMNMWSRVPTERVTGEFTVVLGKTTWILQDVRFDIPTKDGAVLYDTSERPLTDAEKASLPPIAGITPVA
jgi:hypothetical protein